MGQNFARLNFAGPRLEEAGNRSTWWAIHLGGGCRLACNYYTLRADGSPNYPRSWVLQVPRLAPAHATAASFNLLSLPGANSGLCNPSVAAHSVRMPRPVL